MSGEKNNADNPGVIAPPPLIYGVIEREERYLERKFGDEYIEYKVGTQRWI